MARFLLAGVVFLAAVSILVAAESAQQSPVPSAAHERQQIETILQSPAHLDFGHQTTITVGQLLYWLRTEDGLSIRFDIPALATMYGLDPTGGAGPSVATRKISSSLIAALMPPRSNLALELAKPLPKPAIAGSVRQAVNYPPAEAGTATAWDSAASPAPAQAAQTKIITIPAGPLYNDRLARTIEERLQESKLHHYDINIQVLDGTCFLTGSVCDRAQMEIVCDIAKHTDGVKSTINHLRIVATGVPLAQAQPGIANANDKPHIGVPILHSTQEAFAAMAGPRQIVVAGAQQPLPLPIYQALPQPSAAAHAAAKSPDSIQEFLKQANRIEVPVEFVDGQHISVATALRLALDAIPGAEDDSSMPMPLTDAMRLDFLVEDDGILITTRLKALTTKETRVYSLKNLSKMNPQELSTVICQSVRPWSWRSRIDELGEQLKQSAISLPQGALEPIAKSTFELVADATGLDVSADSYDKKSTMSAESQQAAMVGKAVASGLVTLAQASLSAAEVVHYADPPTGSIRVLGDKLVITQSQAAHREIAELLKQLSDE
jgi:hypothetical protein